MFEWYTEKARRVIFFARYEAIQFGSPYIETEHLLLGLLREDPGHLIRVIPQIDPVVLRKEIEAGNRGQLKISTSVDLPLSNESKRVLAYSAEEAERLSHRHVGTEHLLLGLLRQEECYAARTLRQHGASLSGIRSSIGQELPDRPQRVPSVCRLQTKDIVEIHGSAWDLSYVTAATRKLKRFAWQKQALAGLDIAVRLNDGAASFDLSLALDKSTFGILKGGWKEARCTICYWALTVSEETERGTGYTNGRDWLCCECFEKFMGDSTSSSSNYSDIT